MMSFLSQLNFKPPTSMAAFQQALLQGNPAAIYPMLAWMLVRLPELKKRAYAQPAPRPAASSERFGCGLCVRAHRGRTHCGSAPASA